MSRPTQGSLSSSPSFARSRRPRARRGVGATSRRAFVLSALLLLPAFAGFVGVVTAQTTCDLEIVSPPSKSSIKETTDTFSVRLQTQGGCEFGDIVTNVSFAILDAGDCVVWTPTSDHVLRATDFDADRVATIVFSFDLHAAHNTACPFFPDGNAYWPLRVKVAAPVEDDASPANNARIWSVLGVPAFVVSLSGYTMRDARASGSDYRAYEGRDVGIDVRLTNSGHAAGAIKPPAPRLQLTPVSSDGSRLYSSEKYYLNAKAGTDVVGGADADGPGSGTLVFPWTPSVTNFPAGTAGVRIQASVFDVTLEQAPYILWIRAPPFELRRFEGPEGDVLEGRNYSVLADVKVRGTATFQGRAELTAVAVDAAGNTVYSELVNSTPLNSTSEVIVVPLTLKWRTTLPLGDARGWRLKLTLLDDADTIILESSLSNVYRVISDGDLRVESFRGILDSGARIDKTQSEMVLTQSIRLESTIANLGRDSAVANVTFTALDGTGQQVFSYVFANGSIPRGSTRDYSTTWTPTALGEYTLRVEVSGAPYERSPLDNRADLQLVVREVFPYEIDQFAPQSKDPGLKESFYVTIDVANVRPDVPSEAFRVIIQELGADEIMSHELEAPPFTSAEKRRYHFNITPSLESFHVRGCIAAEDGRFLECSAVRGPYRVLSPLAGSPLFTFFAGDAEVKPNDAVEGRGNLTLGVTFDRSRDTPSWAGNITFTMSVMAGAARVAGPLVQERSITPVTDRVEVTYADVLDLEKLAYPCGGALPLRAVLKVENLQYASGFSSLPRTGLRAFLTGPTEPVDEWRDIPLEGLLLADADATGLPESATAKLTGTWAKSPGLPFTIAEWELTREAFGCSGNGRAELPVKWPAALPESFEPDPDGERVTLDFEVTYRAPGGALRPAPAESIELLVIPRPHLAILAESLVHEDARKEPASEARIVNATYSNASEASEFRYVDVVVANVGHAPTTGPFTLVIGTRERGAVVVGESGLAEGARITYRTHIPFANGVQALPVTLEATRAGDTGTADHARTLHAFLASFEIGSGARATNVRDLHLAIDAPGATDVAFRVTGKPTWEAWRPYARGVYAYTWPDLLPSEGVTNLSLDARVRAVMGTGESRVIDTLRDTIQYDREGPVIKVDEIRPRPVGRELALTIVLTINEPGLVWLECAGERVEGSADATLTRFTFEREHLLPGAFYTCGARSEDVLANEGGREIVDIVTPPIAPAPVPAVASVYSVIPNRVHITWESPADDGGSAITGYAILEQDALDSSTCRVVATTGTDARSADVAVARADFGDYLGSGTRAYSVLALNAAQTRESLSRGSCAVTASAVIIAVDVHPQVMPLIAGATILTLVIVLAGIAFTRRSRRGWQSRYRSRGSIGVLERVGLRDGIVRVLAQIRAAMSRKPEKVSDAHASPEIVEVLEPGDES